MEVKFAVLVAVEVHAPLDEVGDALGCIAHHLLHGGRIADVVSCDHGVVDVLFEVIHFEVGDAGDAALCLVGVGLVDGGLADECYFAFAALCDLQCITHSGHARADDEEVEFAYHIGI